MCLTDEQIAFFHENGYVVVENFFARETVARMRNEIERLLATFDYSSARSVFTTKEQQRTSDDYFLTSGDKIRFFWEEGAFDEEGKLVDEPTKCINKVGHALHDLNLVFHDCSYDPRTGRIARQLGLDVPLAVQSMYIFKQPKIGGEVSPHQDGAFLYTEPQSVLGFWWALEDCNTENGCLWAVPGSHRLGVHRRFRRRDDGQGTEFQPPEPIEWDLTDAVSLPVRSGTLVLLHNALVHYSEANKSGQSRHAYSIHVVDGSPGVSYPADNWLQSPEKFNELPSD